MTDNARITSYDSSTSWAEGTAQSAEKKVTRGQAADTVDALCAALFCGSIRYP